MDLQDKIKELKEENAELQKARVTDEDLLSPSRMMAYIPQWLFNKSTGS